MADILLTFNVQRKKVSTADRMKVREPFSILNDAASAGPEFLKISLVYKGEVSWFLFEYVQLWSSSTDSTLFLQQHWQPQSRNRSELGGVTRWPNQDGHSLQVSILKQRKLITNQLTCVPVFIRVIGARILTAVSCTTSTSTLSWTGGKRHIWTRCHFQDLFTILPLFNHYGRVICVLLITEDTDGHNSVGL